MLDILFPKVCPSCGEVPLGREKICRICLEEIRFINYWEFCAKCGVPFGYYNPQEQGDDFDIDAQKADNLCGKCVKGTYSFDKARSIAIYEGGIRDMIISFKYEGKIGYAEALLEIITTNFPDDLGEFNCVIPVPLHLDKLRLREYNQSVILAGGIAKHLRVRCDLFGLRKTRDTIPQIEIRDERERRRNVRGAFSAADGGRFKDQSVLLVDDVFTTGSTSDECSKMLLKSEAYKVQVLTLTRARAM